MHRHAVTDIRAFFEERFALIEVEQTMLVDVDEDGNPCRADSVEVLVTVHVKDL